MVLGRLHNLFSIHGVSLHQQYALRRNTRHQLVAVKLINSPQFREITPKELLDSRMYSLARFFGNKYFGTSYVAA